ncbi:MAG: hypothetical protein ACOYOQ_00110 [Microthrixaceae bacterium]
MRTLADEGDLDGVLIGLAVLDVIRKDLGDLRSDVGAAGAALMTERGEKQIAMEGVGLFERKPDSKRTTDWDAILNEIRQRARVTPDGEVITDAAEAIDRVIELVRLVVPLYRSTNAKQAGLATAGIPKDDVQTTEWKVPNVVYRPAESAK